MKYRRIDNKKFIIVLYGGIALALLLIGLLLYWWYTQRLVGYEPGEATYQLYSDTEFDYDRDTTFYLGDDGAITAKTGDRTDVCPTTPIIFTSGNGLALTKDMSLTTGEDAKTLGRVISFSKLEEAGGLILITRNGQKAQALHGYLYDGDDTYIFLENTVLTVGNQSIGLSPLSYVICKYDDAVEYFDYDTQTLDKIGIVNSDITAESETFKLDLGMDLKLDDEGNKAMLFSSISSLDAISMTK